MNRERFDSVVVCTLNFLKAQRKNFSIFFLQLSIFLFFLLLFKHTLRETGCLIISARGSAQKMIVPARTVCVLYKIKTVCAVSEPTEA